MSGRGQTNCSRSDRYQAVHARCRRWRGSASLQMCIDGCGRNARHWSLNHNKDPSDIYSYDPRCSSCHAKYDRINCAQ